MLEVLVFHYWYNVPAESFELNFTAVMADPPPGKAGTRRTGSELVPVPIHSTYIHRAEVGAK